MNALECRAKLLKVRDDVVRKDMLTIKGKRDKIQAILCEFLISNGYPVVAKEYNDILTELDDQEQTIIQSLLNALKTVRGL